MVEGKSKPRWYVDLFSYRRFWGALSVYSHRRRNDGKPNIAYSTRSKAQKAVRSMEKKYGVPFMAYKCLYCHGWHVARSKAKKESASDILDTDLYPTPVLTTVQSSSPGLDHAAIMATGVADLDPSMEDIEDVPCHHPGRRKSGRHWLQAEFAKSLT